MCYIGFLHIILTFSLENVRMGEKATKKKHGDKPCNKSCNDLGESSNEQHHAGVVSY